MDKKERFRKAFNYLKCEGIIKRQEDLAAIMKASKTNISMAFNGHEKVLTEKFLSRFARSFPGIFSFEWLLTGDGNMLVNESSEVKESPVVSSCDREVEYLRSQLELNKQRIADLQKTISTQETLIAVLQSQIADLQTSEPFFFTPGVAEVSTKTRK